MQEVDLRFAREYGSFGIRPNRSRRCINRKRTPSAAVGLASVLALLVLGQQRQRYEHARRQRNNTAMKQLTLPDGKPRRPMAGDRYRKRQAA